MHSSTRVVTRFTSTLAGAAVLLSATTAQADDEADLAGLLAEPVVSGASKSPEPASDAPATTSVLTAADIHRYGLRSLAETSGPSCSVS